jgi:hypothetical protein
VTVGVKAESSDETTKDTRWKMNEIWILLWALAGIVLPSAGAGMLAGVGMTVGLALILAPRSLEEAWLTLRDGGGRFSVWLSRTLAPRVYGEENK